MHARVRQETTSEVWSGAAVRAAVLGVKAVAAAEYEQASPPAAPHCAGVSSRAGASMRASIRVSIRVYRRTPSGPGPRLRLRAYPSLCLYPSQYPYPSLYSIRVFVIIRVCVPGRVCDSIRVRVSI